MGTARWQTWYTSLPAVSLKLNGNSHRSIFNFAIPGITLIKKWSAQIQMASSPGEGLSYSDTEEDDPLLLKENIRTSVEVSLLFILPSLSFPRSLDF